MMLQFNDGITINTDGPLRKIILTDGIYVVGQGMCCPVGDNDEAEALIAVLSGKNDSVLGSLDDEYDDENWIDW